MMEIPPLNPATLLKRHGLHPQKRLSQNFITDPLALQEIVEAAEIKGTDTVLEVGAGLGSLTRYLAFSAHRVVAVELDPKLLPILQNVLETYPNIHLINGDILKLSSKELGLPPDYLVAANIPYSITSAIIRHLLEANPKPRRIILTIQKEVAQRICARPPDMSLLALSVQVYGKPSLVARISAEAFYPAPKVESAVVRIDIYPSSLIPDLQLDKFFQIIKAGFGQKRKTLRNSLSAGLHISTDQVESMLRQAGIESRRRAETLDIEEWRKLCELE